MLHKGILRVLPSYATDERDDCPLKYPVRPEWMMSYYPPLRYDAPPPPHPGGDCKGMDYKGAVRGRYWVRAKVTVPPPPGGGGGGGGCGPPPPPPPPGEPPPPF